MAKSHIVLTFSLDFVVMYALITLGALQVGEDSGPYYKVAVTADGTAYTGCSGAFKMECENKAFD